MVDQSAQRLTGGQAIVRSLIDQGIKTLYGLPGVQNDWLYNALHDYRNEIRVIHTRHEQGAAFMGLGATLATGQPAVFNVVPGPGLLNASAALSTAYALNAKLLCLTGQIPSPAIGRQLGQLHEINNQLEFLQSLTKWAQRVTSPAEAPLAVSEAFRQMASGRPRPVGLEVPMDILQERGMVDLRPQAGPPTRPPLDEDAIEDAARRLAGASSPMIFVGSGAMEASQHVRALAEALQAPVVAYRTGHGIADGRNPLALHLPAAKQLWAKADVVLAIGSNMRVPMGKWAKAHRPAILRIDVDPTTHRKFGTPDVAITAFAEDALPVLRGRLERHAVKRPDRTQEMEAVRADWQKRASVLEPQLSFLKVIRQELGEDGIFVEELTQVGFASRITFPVYQPRTFISTGYQGTLGFGFPTALGVKSARPEVPVISVTGDGGFLFGVQELATAVQNNIPLVVLVFNNNQYGNVQQMQKSDYGGRVIASDLHNPNFARLAETFGAQGLRAETPEEVRLAIRRGFDVDVPTVIEVPVGDMPSVDRFR